MQFCILFAIFFNITFAADILENICGRPSIKPLLSKEGDREEAIPHSWPWQVSLQRFVEGRFNHICGGTIISPNKVLTTNFCAFKEPKYNLRVAAGKHNHIIVNEAMEEVFSVKNVSLMNGEDLTNINNQDNIVVLTLSSNLIFNENIMPICLSRQDPLPNSTCYVTGWRSLYSYVAENLEQTNLPMSSSCQFNDPRYNISKFMCYGNPTEGFPCEGTSGGPLVCKSSSGIWHQYGMISPGLLCSKNRRGYYTRISFYYDWLQKQIYNDISETTTKPTKPGEKTGNIDYTNPTCGKPSIKPVVFGQDKSLDGEVAKPHSWPWQVSLQMFENNLLTHICGGTIISTNKILCAAHCLKFGMNQNRYKIIVGLHDQYAIEHTARVYSIDNFSLPEGFDYNKNLIPDDIMVISLTEDIMYNDNMMPICLAKNWADVGSTCYVTGWGRNVSVASEITSAVLRQVDIPIQDPSLCKKRAIHGTVFNSTKMLCAGHHEGRKDSCQGDSGGPLVCKGSDKWYQVGIVSTGITCGQEAKPGIYTLVLYYYDWLQKQIHGNTN